MDIAKIFRARLQSSDRKVGDLNLRKYTNRRYGYKGKDRARSQDEAGHLLRVVNLYDFCYYLLRLQ